MTMPASPGYQPPGQGTAGSTDVVTALQGIIRQLASGNKNTLTLISALEALFPQVFGSFTLAAAATTTVTQTAIKANSFPIWIPTNASAATLIGSAKSLYVSALTPGASFTVATASGGSAAGTETFLYAVFNPA
jgi:hypothetical protein